jgi:DNA-binding transcriptional regulator YhcF (GntR family)
LAAATELEVHPDTARRALRTLEKAGLVTIERPAGRALQVTLLEAK